jgi:hypothetical protein
MNAVQPKYRSVVFVRSIGSVRWAQAIQGQTQSTVHAGTAARARTHSADHGGAREGPLLAADSVDSVDLRPPCRHLQRAQPDNQAASEVRKREGTPGVTAIPMPVTGDEGLGPTVENDSSGQQYLPGPRPKLHGPTAGASFEVKSMSNRSPTVRPRASGFSLSRGHFYFAKNGDISISL